MGILEVTDLTLQIDGTPILDRLTIDFWEGHIHAIVGPNGAGKSTLANAIMGLPGYTDVGGDIVLDGRSIKGLTVDERARAGISLAWQEPARFEGLRIRQFILAGAEDKSYDEYERVMGLVNLDPERYRGRSVDRTLSGGERKRIELASIVAMNPRIIMMDEPDSGVDIDAVGHIFNVISILRDRGTTVILITHSAEVLRHADHAFLLCDGRLVDKGTVNKLSAYFEGKCVPCRHQNEPDERVLIQ